MNRQPSTEVEMQLQAKLAALNGTPSLEPAFIKMECLFYDALALARMAAGEGGSPVLLMGLEKIKEQEFQLTQLSYQKAKQREISIKKFKMAFKRELTAYLKSVKSTSAEH